MTDGGPVTRIAQSVVGGLAGQPMLLVLVLLNCAFIGFLAWFLEDQLNQRDQMAKQLFDRCLEMTLKVAP